jgi:hypothetical protein
LFPFISSLFSCSLPFLLCVQPFTGPVIFLFISSSFSSLSFYSACLSHSQHVSIFRRLCVCVCQVMFEIGQCRQTGMKWTLRLLPNVVCVWSIKGFLLLLR